MFNITIIILIILIFQKIFLLNEETLILFCFISFIWIGLKQVGNLIYDNLEEQSNKIENLLKKSLKQTSISLKKYISLKLKLNLLISSFKKLGDHFYKLITLTINKIPLYQKQQLTLIYLKRLLFIRRIEQQVSKLIPLLISSRLVNITDLKYFYTINFKINYFSCLQKISIREYIKLVLIKI
uniref:ATP synthase B chain n=1 Tax=Rhodogorgon sp. TaxID=2485824 RepID=A0A3G3MIU3_9FLOR|nr:ATP synthase B chain precursor [Rhodogorgon sp.]